MMNFINPHAILLSKDNSWEIHVIVGLELDFIDELITDYKEESGTHYLVGWREPKFGLPTYDILTDAEILEKYQLEKLPPYVDSGFRKL